MEDTMKNLKSILAVLVAVSMMAGAAGCAQANTAPADQSKADTAVENESASSEDTVLADSPEWVGKLEAAKDAKQLFVVAGVGDTTAFVSMHQKDDDGNWKEIISTPGFIGKKGLGKTKEGDAKTPIGVFRFTKAFGILDDPGSKMPYQKVTDDDYWSGDMREGHKYNQMVSIKDIPDLNTDDSEHIVDYPVHYQYCMNIGYNEEGIAGEGSAIFLHCLGPEKPYTGGCVAIPKDKLITVLKNADSDCKVVIDHLQNISPDLYDSWGLSDMMSYSDDASDFVLISEAIPDAILEIRYYSTYNFVGDRIAGYEEPVALLTREAATALKEVSDDLRAKGYRLKIYDAYRPQMAVTNFMSWAQDPSDVRMKEYFYPELEKDVLFPQGYIAEHSGHSRGSTVDLTLFDMKTEKEVDMGGTFDYFGELSHPDYKGITDEQYNNRMILRDAMLAHGFKPLAEEWWHFTLENEPYPDTYFTFPVSTKSVRNTSASGTAGMDSAGLEFWSEDSAAAASLTDYVTTVTDKNSDKFIPVEDRIAVFDLDGTLIGELYPSYFEYMMFIHRALHDASYDAPDDMRKFAEALEEGVYGGKMPDNSERLHAKYAGMAYAGMTPDELREYTAEFMKSAADGFTNLTKGDSFYWPMISVVKYLEANDFTVYIVSGSDRTVVRELVKQKLGIPENRVIGMSYTMVADHQDGTDGLEYVYTKDDNVILGGDLIIKTIKMNKVCAIAQEIGKVPVLSFGNTAGDQSMAQYTVNNDQYETRAYMLMCDDLVREHGNMDKANAMKKMCEDCGFVPISMRDDFATIYGDDVEAVDYEQLEVEEALDPAA